MTRVIRGTGLFCINAAKSSTLWCGERQAKTGSKECRESFMRHDKKETSRVICPTSARFSTAVPVYHNRRVHLAVQRLGGTCKTPGAVSPITHWFLYAIRAHLVVKLTRGRGAGGAGDTIDTVACGCVDRPGTGTGAQVSTGRGT
jgi:hypothetical protein